MNGEVLVVSQFFITLSILTVNDFEDFFFSFLPYIFLEKLQKCMDEFELNFQIEINVRFGSFYFKLETC